MRNKNLKNKTVWFRIKEIKKYEKTFFQSQVYFPFLFFWHRWTPFYMNNSHGEVRVSRYGATFRTTDECIFEFKQFKDLTGCFVKILGKYSNLNFDN